MAGFRKPGPTRLTQERLRGVFNGEMGNKFPPILSPQQLAELLGYSLSTIYEWLQQGRFDGAYRKRGKHVRLWRDLALEIFFNGPQWPS